MIKEHTVCIYLHAITSPRNIYISIKYVMLQTYLKIANSSKKYDYFMTDVTVDAVAYSNQSTAIGRGEPVLLDMCIHTYLLLVSVHT